MRCGNCGRELKDSGRATALVKCPGCGSKTWVKKDSKQPRSLQSSEGEQEFTDGHSDGNLGKRDRTVDWLHQVLPDIALPDHYAKKVPNRLLARLKGKDDTNRGALVHRFNLDQLNSLEIMLQNSKFVYRQTREPVDTTESCLPLFDLRLEHFESYSGAERAIFYLAKGNRLFICDPLGWLIKLNKDNWHGDYKLIHHSSFCLAGDCMAAGDLSVKGGELTSITSATGHFHTPVANFLFALEWLRNRGLRNLDDVPLIAFSDDGPFQTRFNGLKNGRYRAERNQSPEPIPIQGNPYSGAPRGGNPYSGPPRGRNPYSGPPRGR